MKTDAAGPREGRPGPAVKDNVLQQGEGVKNPKLQSVHVEFSQEEKNKHKARALNMIAVIFEEKNELRKAAAALKQCIGLAPSNPYYYEKLGLMLLRSDSKEKKTEGYGLLKKAAEKGSQNKSIYYILGEYFRKSENP